MIKEFVLTIILGAVLGFGITGSYIVIHKNGQQTISATNIQTSPTPIISETIIETTPTPTSTITNPNLTITAPENNSILSTETTSIKGTAKNNSSIIISTNSQTFTGQANSNGIFSINITLNSGANLVKITAIDSDDNQTETELLLTYSTTKI